LDTGGHKLAVGKLRTREHGIVVVVADLMKPISKPVDYGVKKAHTFARLTSGTPPTSMNSRNAIGMVLMELSPQ
jgi:hypothetical protein